MSVSTCDVDDSDVTSSLVSEPNQTVFAVTTTRTPPHSCYSLCCIDVSDCLHPSRVLVLLTDNLLGFHTSCDDVTVL